jgi:ribosomal protein S1
VAKHALKATIEENLAAQVSADIISPPATSASENFAFHVGDIYNATVTSAFKLGVYVELDGSKQQVLLSRLLLSFAQYRNMSEEIGDAVQIVLTEIDHENRTLSGTLVGNPTTPPPDLPMSTSRGTSLQTREPRVKRDLSVLAKADSSKIYKGKTVGCQDFGVFVELDEYPGAQGVLPFKFVPGRFLNDLKVNYTPNKEIDVMIYDVDVASGRLTLSMMQERRKDLSEFENFNSSDVWPGVISEIVPYGIIVNLKVL